MMNNDDQLVEYQRMCNILCTSENTAERNQAETLLFGFISNLQNLPKIEMILSETNDLFTVFATFEYLAKTFAAIRTEDEEDKKNSPTHTNQRELLLKVVELILNFTNQKPVFLSKSLTLNSTAHLLATLTDKLWNLLDEPLILIQKLQLNGNILKNPEAELFRMKVYEYIINSIASYENKTSYLYFRKRMTSFQDSGLFYIYGQSEELIDRILLLSQENALGNIDNKLLFEIMDKALQNMFLCLHFNFNISYFEFDNEADTYEQVIVNFPEKWTQYIGKYSTQENLRKIVINCFTKNPSICLKCLRCLNRIASAKLTLFPEKTHSKPFLQNCFKTAFEITQLVTQNLQKDYILDVIEINLKIVNNNVKKFRKMETFSKWIDLFFEWTLKLLDIPISINETVLPRLMEFWKKVRRQFQTEVKLAFYTEDVSKYTGMIIQKMICKLLEFACGFFKDLSYNNYKRFTKNIKLFFEFFGDMFPINQRENLQLVDQELTKCSILFEQIMKNAAINGFDDIIYKLCMLLCIVQYGILTFANNDKSVSTETQSEEETTIQGIILAKVLNLIQFISNLSTEEVSLNKTLDLTILCFISEYFKLTLNSRDTLNEHQAIQCRAKIYQISVPVLGSDDFSKIIELLLMKVIKNLTINDETILNFSIFLLRTILLKLKNYIPREKFETLPIVNVVSNVFQNLDRTSLKSSKYTKYRTKVFEIVAIMYLDDYYDNYLVSTQKICLNIYKTNILDAPILGAENLIKFFRDITGLSNYIDTNKIYRYFFKACYDTVIKLIVEYLPQFSSNHELLLSVFDVFHSFIQNRAQRISTDHNSSIPYQMFRDYSRILASNTEFLLQIVDIDSNSEKFDIQIKIIGKLMKIFNSFFQGKIINFSVFQFFGDLSFINFLKNNSQVLHAYSKCMQYYPKYLELFMDNLTIIADNTIEIVFRYCHQLILKVFELTFDVFRRLCENKLPLRESGGYSEAIIFSKIGTINYSIFSFVFSEVNFQDSDEIKENIKDFLSSSEGLLKEFFDFAFSSALLNEKQNKSHLVFTQILFCLTVTNGKLLEEAKLSFIKNHATNENQAIYISKLFQEITKDVERKFDSVNVDKFSKNLRNPLKILNKIIQTKSFDFLNDMEVY